MKTMIGLLNEYAMPMRRKDDMRFEDDDEFDFDMDSGEDDMDMDSGEDDMRKERSTLRASKQSRMAKMLSDAVRYGQRNSKVSVEEAIDDLMASYKK